MEPLTSILVVVLIHYIFNIVEFDIVSEKKVFIKELQEKLKNTSAQDEFAKWAKLKRNFDKKIVELQLLRKNQSNYIFLIQSILWSLQIGLLVYYMYEPMFYVPLEWFGPLTNWLKFPFAPNGSCGIFYWWCAIKSVLYQSTNLYNSLFKK